MNQSLISSKRNKDMYSRVLQKPNMHVLCQMGKIYNNEAQVETVHKLSCTELRSPEDKAHCHLTRTRKCCQHESRPALTVRHANSSPYKHILVGGS
uniref:Uncharacterized protein n=1 Tax=Arundo donax TaxID=35708 RepID=A0A0A9V276_ARUDO